MILPLWSRRRVFPPTQWTNASDGSPCCLFWNSTSNLKRCHRLSLLPGQGHYRANCHSAQGAVRRHLLTHCRRCGSYLWHPNRSAWPDRARTHVPQVSRGCIPLDMSRYQTQDQCARFYSSIAAIKWSRRRLARSHPLCLCYRLADKRPIYVNCSTPIWRRHLPLFAASAIPDCSRARLPRNRCYSTASHPRRLSISLVKGFFRNTRYLHRWLRRIRHVLPDNVPIEAKKSFIFNREKYTDS